MSLCSVEHILPNESSQDFDKLDVGIMRNMDFSSRNLNFLLLGKYTVKPAYGIAISVGSTWH